MSKIHTLLYGLIRQPIISAVSFSFRHVYVRGYESIKHIRPVIFAPNHQITFLDGIVIVRTATKTQPNILVRSDIFKSPWAIAALKLIRLLPVYRKRDNMGSLTQNEQIFNMCHDIFRQKGSVILFPEGSHMLKKQLRPLQKGIGRIALGAEEKYNNSLDLHIVPVGINFRDYLRQWTDLYLYFGKPIRVNDYYEQYLKNPNKAMLALKDDLEANLKDEVIHISNDEYYEELEFLPEIIGEDIYAIGGIDKEQKSLRVFAENKLIRNIEANAGQDLPHLRQLIRPFSIYKQKTGLNKVSCLFERTAYYSTIGRVLFLFLCSPIAAISYLLNVLPNYLINKKIITGFKDQAWWRSIAMGMYIVLYPLVFGGLATIVGLMVGDWLMGGVAFFSFALISIVGKEYQVSKRRFTDEIKSARFKKAYPDDFEQLLANRNQLLQIVKHAVKP